MMRTPFIQPINANPSGDLKAALCGCSPLFVELPQPGVVNVFRDPTFEGTTELSDMGVEPIGQCSIFRSPTCPIDGAASLAIQPAGGDNGVEIMVELEYACTRYSVAVDVCADCLPDRRIEVVVRNYCGTQNVYFARTFDARCCPTRLYATFKTADAAECGLFIVQIRALDTSGGHWQIDNLIVNEGDPQEFGSISEWEFLGGVNASLSRRVNCAVGGTKVSLFDYFDQVSGYSGLGLPNVSQNTLSSGGSLVTQSTAMGANVFEISGTLGGSRDEWIAMLQKWSQLIDVNPITKRGRARRFHYADCELCGEFVFMAEYSGDAFAWNNNSHFGETIVAQWTVIDGIKSRRDDVGLLKTALSAVRSQNIVARNVASGELFDLGGGLSHAVTAVLVSARGDIYAAHLGGEIARFNSSAGRWDTLSKFQGEVNALAESNTGEIWVGGLFTSGVVSNVGVINLGTGEMAAPALTQPNGRVYSIMFLRRSPVGGNGAACIGGEFTNLGAKPYWAVLPSGYTSWVAPGGLYTALNGAVLAQAERCDGTILIGGRFSTPFAGAALYNPTAGSMAQVGGGLGGSAIEVNEIAVDESTCNAYFGGHFATIGGQVANSFFALSQTGAVYVSPGALKASSVGTIKQVDVPAAGLVTLSGEFDSIGRVYAQNGVADVTLAGFFPLSVGCEVGIGASAIHSSGGVQVFGGDFACAVRIASITDVNYCGDVAVYPLVRITAGDYAARLRSVSNYSIGLSLTFKDTAVIAAGDTWTIDPANGQVASAARGVLTGVLINSSSLPLFRLDPSRGTQVCGVNRIGVFVDGVAQASISWRTKYKSGVSALRVRTGGCDG